MRRAYPQDCTVGTANEKVSVGYSTLRIDGVLDDSQRAAIDQVVRQQGGSAVWRSSEPASRTYALLEFPAGYDHAAVRAASGGVLYDEPVIALALFPAVAQALPSLLDALGGSGRPVGVLSCTACNDGAIVEWDPQLTRTAVIVGLVDLELRRFASGRVAELLSPLPPALVAAIAASGLQAPQVTPERILELRIDRA